MMQMSHHQGFSTVEAMVKALQTGNYSVVLGWITKDISESERRQLEEAASVGQALGLIMRPQSVASSLDGQKPAENSLNFVSLSKYKINLS